MDKLSRCRRCEAMNSAGSVRQTALTAAIQALPINSQ